MSYRTALSAVFVALLVATACTTTTYTTIRHPLQVGGVDANSVPSENVRDEDRRQLPRGTLVDEAQLLTLTPDQICLRVTLWSTQIDPARSDYSQYRIALLADRAGVENTTGQIQLEQGTVAQYQGVQSQTRAGGTYGVRRTLSSFTYQVARQPATLCFANGGFVTPSTTHLNLELQGPANLNFEWDFDSSVQGQPAQ